MRLISDEQYASLVETDHERMIKNVGSMGILEWLDTMPRDQSAFWGIQVFHTTEDYGNGNHFRNVKDFLVTWLYAREVETQPCDDGSGWRDPEFPSDARVR